MAALPRGDHPLRRHDGATRGRRLRDRRGDDQPVHLPAGLLLRDGRQPRRLRRQPLVGLRARQPPRRQGNVDLLLVGFGREAPALGQGVQRDWVGNRAISLKTEHSISGKGSGSTWDNSKS